MKTIKVLSAIFYLISAVFVPISLFEVNGKLIIGIIGYCSLILGGILGLIESSLRIIAKNKKKEDKDIN